MDGAVQGGDRGNLNSNFQIDLSQLLEVDVVIGMGIGLEENLNSLSVRRNQNLIRPAIGPCGEGGEMTGPVIELSEPVTSGPMLIEEDYLTGWSSGTLALYLKGGF